VSLVFGELNKSGDEERDILRKHVRRLGMKLEDQIMEELKYYQNVLSPLDSASKAVIQVNLTAPHTGNCQNPMYLSGSMDWDDPYILFPVSGMLRTSPQLLVDSLVTYLGQSMSGEDGASLGKMVV